MWTHGGAGRASAVVVLATLIVGLASTGSAPAQTQGEKAEARSSVIDSAEMFTPASAEKARAVLRVLEERFKVATRVQTLATLGGRPPVEVARERAEGLGDPGIMILVVKNDQKFEIVASHALADALPRAELLKIQAAFLGPFNRKDFDKGLDDGLHALAASLESALARARPVVSEKTSALVIRNQVRLTLDGARLIIAGAEAKAVEMKLKLNIAVVDDGGHLLAFARMDGARPASGYTAITKATTAATFRQETGPLPKGSTPDVLLNLSLQNAAHASGGKVTTLLGGIPVVVDGQVIGGVGIGGGSGEQDAEVARAGITRLLAELEGKTPAVSK